MYAVYTRSKREPYYIEDDVKGQELSNKWMEGTLPTKVDLGKAVIESAQIKSIEANVRPEDNDDWWERAANEKKNNLKQYYQKIDAEYEEYKQRRRLMSKQELAEDMALANLVWYAHTGSRKIPKDAAQAIVEAQRAYLEDNPNVTRANPICYKDIMLNAARKTLKQDQPKPYMTQATMMLVARIISADKFA